jgi:bifunctional non-homologous end joining protein LigD
MRPVHFQNPVHPTGVEKLVWLKTELVTQIDFTEWTPDGHLRHSKFVGLREDKEAGGVVREPGS